MNPVLHSLDSLLNRFDELSQRHSSLVSDFGTTFTDIDNPLQDVTRDENERRRTSENLLKITIEDESQVGSCATIEEFNRRVRKSRCGFGPPSYSSNENNSLYPRAPSRNSWITVESAPLPRTTTTAVQVPSKTSISQTVSVTSMENLLDAKHRPTTTTTTKVKPSVTVQNPPSFRRSPHRAITTFTMETAIRLSKPRARRHRSPEEKLSPKRLQRRSKYFPSPKREAPQSSNASIPVPPPPQRPFLVAAPPKPKRTNATTMKSPPKKHKPDTLSHTGTSKRIPMSNYPRPVVSLAAPPTISLAFPMQPELNSSRVMVLPKANPIVAHSPLRKTMQILTNKRSLISSNRMSYLMT